MKYKIAVIATDFLKDFVEDALRKTLSGGEQSSLDFSYEFFIYHSLGDVRDICDHIGKDFDGILTSGSFPARMVEIYAPENKLPVRFFNTDEAALYRLFLSLIIENRNLDLSRVYADILEVFGVRTVDFLENRAAMPDNSALAPNVFTLEKMLAIEKEQYEKHLSLWNEKKTDVSVSRFSSIVPALKEKGVNIHFPYPSIQYFRSVCAELLREIERKKLEASQPAVVILRLSSASSLPSTQTELDYLRLEQLVMEFIGTSALNYSVQRQQYGLEIVMTGKDCSEWTTYFRQERIRPFLADRLSHTLVSIGYGLGGSLSQARFRALDACREAELKKGTSYLINEKDELVGPLSHGTESMPIHLSVADTELSDIHSSLSPLTVRKIFSVLNNAESGSITARELALRLGITKRSANRFLTALHKEGYLDISHKTRTTTKGRPENVFIRSDKS